MNKNMQLFKTAYYANLQVIQQLVKHPQDL